MAAVISAAAAARASDPEVVFLTGSEVQFGDGGGLVVDRVRSLAGAGAQSGFLALVSGSSPGAPRAPMLVYGAAATASPAPVLVAAGAEPALLGPVDTAWGINHTAVSVASSVMLARHADLAPLPAVGLPDSLCVGDQVRHWEGSPLGTARRWKSFRNVRVASATQGSPRALFVGDSTLIAPPGTLATGVYLMDMGSGTVSTVLSPNSSIGGLQPAPTDSVTSLAASPLGKRLAAVVRFSGLPAAAAQGVAVGTARPSSPGYDLSLWACGGPGFRQGEALTASGGRAGDTWAAFREVAANEADGAAQSYLLSARVWNPASGHAEVLVRNCAVLLRTGDVVGGAALAGPFVGLRLNASGDWLACAALSEPGRQALILNGQALAATGDVVMVPHAGAECPALVRSFKAPHSLELSGRGPGGAVSVLYAAVVDLDACGGGTREVILRRTVRVGPGTVCLADWDRDGQRTIDDIFIFISDWFAGHGDLDGDGVRSIDEIFIFLNIWFAGC